MPKPNQERPLLLDIVVVIGLVAAGVSLRLYFRDLPNFAPVAALALFAGFYLSRMWIALAVPLGIMFITDRILGGYDFGTMALVYGALMLPVLMRGPLRKYLDFDRLDFLGGLRTAGGWLACTTGSSLLFFGVSNLGVLLWFNLYERTWSGLLECYLAALPFFRYTLAGDMFFGVALFGGYAALRLFRANHEESPALA